MELIKEKSFTDERVLLDGNQFERCVFTRCSLVFNGTKEFSLDSNEFVHSKGVFFEGSASTLRMFHRIYHGQFRSMVEDVFLTTFGRQKSDVGKNCHSAERLSASSLGRPFGEALGKGSKAPALARASERNAFFRKDQIMAVEDLSLDWRK